MPRTLRQLLDANKALRFAERAVVPRVQGMIRRFTLGRATQGTADTVRVNGTTFGESATEAEHLQTYGLASVPPSGSEGVYLKQIGAVICLDSRGNRPALNAGEVAIYCEHGQVVHLKDDGSIQLTAASGQDVSIGSGAALGDFLTALHSAIVAWTPTSQDGGAALKTALATWLAKTPPGVAP